MEKFKSDIFKSERVSDFVKEMPEEEFEENDCKCSLCKCMNNVYTRWEKWEPTTSFEHIFKKHIENMN